MLIFRYLSIYYIFLFDINLDFYKYNYKSGIYIFFKYHNIYFEFIYILTYHIHLNFNIHT